MDQRLATFTEATAALERSFGVLEKTAVETLLKQPQSMVPPPVSRLLDSITECSSRARRVHRRALLAQRAQHEAPEQFQVALGTAQDQLDQLAGMCAADVHSLDRLREVASATKRAVADWSGPPDEAREHRLTEQWRRWRRVVRVGLTDTQERLRAAGMAVCACWRELASRSSPPPVQISNRNVIGRVIAGSGAREEAGFPGSGS